MFMKKKPMSDLEKAAKLKALKGAHGMASDAMKDSLGGVKKVSVIAPDKKGLEKGLELAEKVIGDEEEEDDESSPFGSELGDSGAAESEESEENDFENMSEEELDAKIQELMALKEKMHDEE